MEKVLKIAFIEIFSRQKTLNKKTQTQICVLPALRGVDRPSA